jgi:DNA-binding response OmpR family regulator
MPLPSVLIVEDDAAIRKLLEAALTREPLQVECASDGAEALEKLAQKNYALLLLDLMLPRVSGLEVLERLSMRAAPRPMVFVITAYDEAMIRKLDVRIVHGILRKPFDLTRLVELVRECALHWQAATSPDLAPHDPGPQLTC